MTNEIVDLNNLPGNSRKAKVTPVSEPTADKKLVEKVVTGKVVRTQKRFIDKFAETFFGDDAKTVVHYVIWDVMIPAAKNTLSDMVQTGIDMLLFGEKRSKRTQRSGSSSFVSYGNYYNQSNRQRNTRTSQRTRHNFEDVVIATRQEAEEVLSGLVELIEDYDVATVADFLALVGEESEFTDDKYGWTNLRNARVDRVRDGYILVLPRPIATD